MAGVYVYDLNTVMSMNDSDYFLINQGTKLVRLQKSVLLKLLNSLTSEQLEKVETIKVDEDGKLFLDNAGKYRTVTLDDISDLNDGVDDIINAFTVDDDGQLLFNGQTLGGEGGSVYELPVASTDVLGGVKVDGNTITINENGVISGSSNYELPVATTSVLGGVKPDGTTITVDENGIISGASTYELPKATTTNLGGIMVDGTTITVNADGVITCINEGSVIATWASNVEYPAGCVIVYETTMYKCLETHTSGDTFDGTKWMALTGEKGDAGISPTAKTEQTETGATISVTDANGTTTSVLTNGKNGDDGITPHIDETTKNWFIGEEDTGVLAQATSTVITSAVVYTGTLSVENWVGDTAPYVQEVSINGISAESRPYLYVSYSSDDGVTILEEQKQWSYITRAVSSENTIIFYCYKNKPTISLNFEAEVR